MYRNNIKKINLFKEINFKTGISNNYSKKILESLFEIIITGLIRDKIVKINNFGIFKIIDKKERLGRNPKTKESHIISARKVATFKPSAYFKKKLNKNYV
jgi:integration host factor subunit alpha|tara:strand:+ start:389 stop:688 length:300 start_codon:yes stop_codon:yes gene_type:complete